MHSYCDPASLTVNRAGGRNQITLAVHPATGKQKHIATNQNMLTVETAGGRTVSTLAAHPAAVANGSIQR